MLSAATSDGGFINIFDHSLEWYVTRYAASLILYLVSGHRVNSTDDKYVQISESVSGGTTQCGNPGSQLVDIFPAREFSLFFFLEFALSWYFNPFLLSETFTWMASRDGLETTCSQGSQRYWRDGKHAPRRGERKHGQPSSWHSRDNLLIPRRN